MTFDLLAILVFIVASFIYAAFVPSHSRGWFLFLGSLLAVYWLQPPLPIRFSDYILPTATIFLTVITWWLTRMPADKSQGASAVADRWGLAAIAIVIIGISLFRYVDADYRLTASRPPSPLLVIAAILSLGLGLAALRWLAERRKADTSRQRGLQVSRAVLTLAIVSLIILFVVLKTEDLSTAVSRFWRGLTGQDTSLATPLDLQWLGFSFVAFRLIHTLRDRQTGILPALSLREYVSYVIFFPAYTAGPIDRAERFLGDYRALPKMTGLDAGRFALGLERILIGLFKKFVIADLLVQGVSLNAINATQATSGLGLWILLYGYALRIYLDFGGYSDIAIGIGILFGIRLPENFKRPYLRTNITAFWQGWHITLSSWVRFYVFTPLSRWMLRQSWQPPSTVVVLIAQLSTMAIIGLWHGITLNFFIWGLWHGAGLFVHKLWSDRTRRWYRGLGDSPWTRRGWIIFSWFITFQYVVLGWVWFALPSTSQSVTVFGRLFGVGW